MSIIAFANQKGGVGKTTTTVTLGHGLAREGFNVLLVDLDSQGNVADSLGMDPSGDLGRLLAPGNPVPLEQAITPSGRPRLTVVRSDKTTASLKQTLAGVPLREYVLGDALENAAYDLILLDCAPSVDLFHYAALVAADWLIVPTRLDKLSVNGLRDVLETLLSLERISHCQLAGVIPTFFERVTKESHEQLVHLARSFGRQVLPPIPQDTQCREASRFGKTLWEYAPRSRALVGLTTNGSGKLFGGYAQVLERIKELV